MVKYLKNEFGKNTLTLLTGTIIAQAIPIAIAPILTRLYSPEDFGLFALYLGLLTTISVVISCRYEQAILFPSDDSDAVNLVALSIGLAFLVSLLALIIILSFGSTISIWVGSPEIEPLLYFLPIALLASGFYQSLSAWSNRKKEYTLLAKSRVSQSLVLSGVQVAGGIAGSSTFLVLGDFLGRVSLAVSLFFRSRKYFLSKRYVLSISKQKMLMQKYKKFPIYDVWGTLANTASYQVQNILFPVFYGLASAGYYFLILRVLQAPLSIISSSLTDVFKQKLTDPQTSDEDLKRYYKNMFFGLLLTGLPLLILFILFAEPMFVFIFGQEWRPAGAYAVILAPMFYLRFIASPLSYFLYLKEKQMVDMIGNSSFLIAGIFSIVLGGGIENSFYLISGSFSFIYIGYIAYSAKLAELF